MMLKESADDDRQVFRLAFYGMRASGKTCILSALSLPRVPHPDGLSCHWKEHVPGHPLPAGDPSTWNTDDPFHAGWKWLCEQRDRLRRGELPLPNPNREGAMKFMFAFGAPDRGSIDVELVDYSGELITASASELAARLREHMRDCDGLLLLAEVPHQNGTLRPLAEDLEKLQGAFLTLLRERDDGPQPDWPIAVLFNKWDRRASSGKNGDASPGEAIYAFLNDTQDLPHGTLLQTLHNAVGRYNVQAFPVSAFGKHKIGDDGAEAPVLDGAMLSSFGLEDGFVWVTSRCGELRVESIERDAAAASWCKFWQLAVGMSHARDAGDSFLGRQLFRGVSPLRAASAGWKLRRRFTGASTLRKRATRAVRWLIGKTLSQLVVTAVLMFALLSVGQAVLDVVRYRTVLMTKDNPSATSEALKHSEEWLADYFRQPGYLRGLSFSVTVHGFETDLGSFSAMG